MITDIILFYLRRMRRYRGDAKRGRIAVYLDYFPDYIEEKGDGYEQ